MKLSHLTRPTQTASIRCVLLAAALALGLTKLAAQSTDAGIVRGKVLNDQTAVFLEGAEMILQPSGQRGNSERDGSFIFRNVAPGDSSLTVRYPGLDSQEVPVKVVAGQATELQVRLKEEGPFALETFVVQSTKSGMAKAIAMQKAADNIKMIAAADQFGDISGNMGEYLKYIPGVGPDGFDARNVSLRGMAPFLTNITLDSTRVASASSGDLTRISELETLSLSNVETIEVIKTLTPDQSATNTAGSINMVSKSAFDQERPLTKYRLYLNVPGEPGFERLRGPGADSGERMTYIRPNLELDVTRKLGKNFGIYVGARAYHYTKPEQVRGQWEYEFNPANGGLPHDPAPNFWRLHNERNVKTNRSASLRLDWRISPMTKLSVSGSWNLYEVKFHYNNLEFNWNTRPALAFGATPQFTYSTGNARSSVSASTGNEAGFIEMVVVDRLKQAHAYTTSSALEHLFRNGDLLKFEGYYSGSDNRYRDHTLDRFGEGYTRISNVRIETRDVGVAMPNFIINRNADGRGTATTPLDLGDITNYRLRHAHTMPSTAFEDRYGVSGDFTKQFDFRMPTTIKIGARWDETDRSMDRRFRITLGEPLVPTGGGMLAIKDDVASAAPGALGFPGTPAFIDLKKVWSLFSNQPTRQFSSDYWADFDEENTAAYVRADVKPAEDWLVVGGVRHEEVRASNLNKLLGAKGSFRNKGDFASLNVKYTPTSKQVWRAAVTQSIGLPDYGDLLPGALTIVNPGETGGRGRVTLSNPALDPYEVLNFDLAYEYHFRKTGFFNVAVFRKEFSNYIVSGTRAMDTGLAESVGLDPAELSGNIADYDLVTRFNVADKGYYNGLEVSYAEQLTFLPKPFNTLGVQANFTLLDIDPIKTRNVLIATDAAQNAALVEQVERALETNAIPVQANLILNWRYRKLAALAAISYTGRTLRSVSRQTIQYAGRPTEYLNVLRRNEARTVVDLKLEYRWRKEVVPYIQVRNLFNTAGRLTANGYYVYDNTNSWPTYEIGIRGQF